MISYSRATFNDVEPLDAMARASWIETFGTGYSAEDLQAYLAGAYGPTGRLRVDLANPEVVIQIARSGEEIIGFAKIVPPDLAQAGERDLQLSQLYVLRAFQGSGVAAELMAWAITHARERDAPALLLTVWEHNPRALRFYARHGFEHIGDYGFAVGSTIDRDLVLRLAL